MKPSPAFPTFGDVPGGGFDVPGGFEVHMNVGYAHLDVLTAEDNPPFGEATGSTNNVIGPLSDFIARNIQ